MSAGEFAFMAMGLTLGVAAGAALIEILRARPTLGREVRVTVARDAIPRRRASTLADDAFVRAGVSAEPARGGPADRDDLSPEHRTPVRDSRRDAAPAPVFRLSRPDTIASVARAVPVSSGVDPMLATLRATASVGAVAAGGAEAAGGAVATIESIPVTSTALDRESARRTADAADAARPDAAQPAGPCADARRMADERCELAGRAREQATVVASAHRAAQRADDVHEAAIAAAMAAADARSIRRAKNEAQARFRDDRARAGTTEAIEAAARTWLLGINSINAEARDATATLAREQARAPEIAATLERTAIEADAARITAETAEAACLTARGAASDCEEREAGKLPDRQSSVPSPGPADWPAGSGDELLEAIRAGRSPRIFRLLRGERAAMREMIPALAGDDADGQRRCQRSLSDLIDAIVADGLAAGALEFPSEHPFWEPFSREQARDIAAALASLGYRFDGLGGWVDDRIPSQRDLSLALGYAGEDPMRMRHWPTETEVTELWADVRVAAAEHLAASAGDLTLGELVTMLGRRADGLADVWNAWARIRPLLLEEM